MAYYHLFLDQEKQEPYVVKRGFNFFAFIFGAFYFIYKKCFISAAAFFSASLALTAMNAFFELPEALWVCISMIFSFYIGFDANDCLVSEYHKKNYRYIKSDFYPSKEQAIAEIFKTHQ